MRSSVQVHGRDLKIPNAAFPVFQADLRDLWVIIPGRMGLFGGIRTQLWITGGGCSSQAPPSHPPAPPLFPRPPASLYPPASGSRFPVTAAAPACRRSHRRSQVRILLLTHASSASRTGQLNPGPVSPLLMLLTSLFPPQPSVKAPPQTKVTGQPGPFTHVRRSATTCKQAHF